MIHIILADLSYHWLRNYTWRQKQEACEYLAVERTSSQVQEGGQSVWPRRWVVSALASRERILSSGRSGGVPHSQSALHPDFHRKETQAASWAPSWRQTPSPARSHTCLSFSGKLSSLLGLPQVQKANLIKRSEKMQKQRKQSSKTKNNSHPVYLTS